jgi:DNA-directed RNA polymerase subunit RPC12/RpoP
MCKKGHEWQGPISNKTIKNYACSACSSKATKDNNLRIDRPDIADQWHPKNNDPIWPEHVTTNSNKKVWWMCDNGHEWVGLVKNRAIYNNVCPHCDRNNFKEYNLLELHPDIARQWHPTKNGPLQPDDVTPGSAKKVWWICSKGHEWRTKIYYRKNNDCPYCKNRFLSKKHNLLAKFPKVAKLWHPVKNGDLTPGKVAPHANRKVWWQCKKGHQWQSKVNYRTRASGCPFCSGKRKYKGNLS